MFKIIEVETKDLIDINPLWIYFETKYGNIISKKFIKSEYQYDKFIKSNNIVSAVIENESDVIYSNNDIKILLSMELYTDSFSYDYKIIDNKIISLIELELIESILNKYKKFILSFNYIPNKKNFEYIEIYF